MPNTTIKETMLAANLQQNQALRARIEAVVRDKLWAAAANIDPTVPLPLDDLAWAVASTNAIRTAVRNAMDDGENANINQNIDAITDAALVASVTAAMTRLKIGVAPVAP